MIRAVLVLESAGLKTSHLLIFTSTDESDCRAVWASGIGPSGVSAQATKPASKATNANEVASIILLRLRTSFHPSYGTAARKCTISTRSQVEVRMWPHSLITAHATLHICGTWLVTRLIPHKLVPAFYHNSSLDVWVRTITCHPVKVHSYVFSLSQTRTLNGRNSMLSCEHNRISSFRNKVGESIAL
jgi:hypothetical protein